MASRSAGRYPRTRAGSTSVSRIEAGIAAPWSRPIASASASGAPLGSVGSLPRGKEPAQRRGVDRLDLTTERGEGALPQPAQHARRRTTPARRPPGRNAPDETVPSASSHSSAARTRAAEAPSLAATSVIVNGPCVRANRATKPSSGSNRWFGEDPGQPHRQRDPERVAEPGGIVDGSDALLVGHAKAHGPATVDQRRDERRRIAISTLGDLFLGQVPDRPQEVVNPVCPSRPATVGEPLELELGLIDRPGIEQVAELLGAEQLTQQVAVQARGRWHGARPAAHRLRTSPRRSIGRAAIARTGTLALCRPPRVSWSAIEGRP